MTDVFVRTSTRKKEISLDVELTGVKQAGPVQVVADMLNEKGEVEKSFAADATVVAKETQTVALSWPWADPRLWDVGQPNLYTLRLKVKGAGLDDEYNQKFGFREFWIEGRQFYLNGTVIHLRQPCFYNGPRMQVGDTFSEMGAANVDTRGDTADSGRNLDDADRKGYLVAQYILNANKYMMGSRGQIDLGAEPAACLRARRRLDAPLPQPSLRGHVDRRLQFLQQRRGRRSAPHGPPRLGSERRALAAPHGRRQGDVRRAQEARPHPSLLQPLRGLYGRHLHDELLPGPHPAPGARRLAQRMGRKRRDADFHGRVRHPDGLHVPARAPRV